MLTFQTIEQNDTYSGTVRSGYTFIYVPQLKSSILFGGCRDVDVMLFDHLKKQWSGKTTTGKKPTARKYHAATYTEHISSLLIMGGQDQSGKSLEDFYLLSIKDWKWKKLLLLKQPSPRQRHSLLSISDTEFIIFGGVSMPYNELTNDLWRLSLNVKLDSNKNEVINLECNEIKVKGTPEGKCTADSTVLLGQRIYTACSRATTKQGQRIELYCLQIRKKTWQKLEISFPRCQLKLFTVVTAQNDSTFLICSQEKNAAAQYHLFHEQTNKLLEIQLNSKATFDCFADELSYQSSGADQFATFFKGKRLIILGYQLEERPEQQEGGNSIEDYLIAIKHEQILSQQLIKKNNLLEEVYKQMQNYITTVHREYINFEEDAAVESEKARHFQDCRHLKTEYSKLDKLYEDVCANIKFLRGELGAINEDFQRCMETEFDEEA